MTEISSPDVAVVCPNLTMDNRRKMPWRYFFEVAEYLDGFGYDVIIITDMESEVGSDSIANHNVESLFTPTGLSDSFQIFINRVSPTMTILNLTPSTLLRGDFAQSIESYLVGVFTSTLYRFSELRNLGFQTNYKYRNYLKRFWVESFIPDRLMKRSLSSIDSLITLSKHNQERIQPHASTGVDVIPPGIEESDLTYPAETTSKYLTDNKPSLLYFTSPLTLRGTDTLVKAFAQVRERYDCELVILSRPDNEQMAQEEATLHRIAEERGVMEDFHLISKYLESETIRAHLRDADIVCLPYKIVISEVPISLYEVQAMRTPVVSTEVSCIPEAIEDGGVTVKPANVSSTESALVELLEDESKRQSLGAAGRQAMKDHLRWKDVGEEYSKIFKHGCS